MFFSKSCEKKVWSYQQKLAPHISFSDGRINYVNSDFHRLLSGVMLYPTSPNGFSGCYLHTCQKCALKVNTKIIYISYLFLLLLGYWKKTFCHAAHANSVLSQICNAVTTGRGSVLVCNSVVVKQLSKNIFTW